MYMIELIVKVHAGEHITRVVLYRYALPVRKAMAM